MGTYILGSGAPGDGDGGEPLDFDDLMVVAADGSAPDDDSTSPSISADGGFVAFQSFAINLVAEGAGGVSNIYIHDRGTGHTEPISAGQDGSPSDDDSTSPSVSADGRFVTFQSFGTSLAGDGSDGTSNVFVLDRETGRTVLASVSSDGRGGDDDSGAPSISADGRFVAFQSFASNLGTTGTAGEPNVFVRDRDGGLTGQIGEGSRPSISADGRFVAFESSFGSVLLHDRQTKTTVVASRAADGSSADDDSGSASISADGRYVAFQSFASNLVTGGTGPVSNIFVYARDTGSVELVSVAADDDSGAPSISADGRFVAFQSFASNLSPGLTNGMSNVFVYDRETGSTAQLSVPLDGFPPDDDSGSPSISADGRYVAFQSFASGMVPGDTGGVQGIYVLRNPLSRTRGDADGDDLVSVSDVEAVAALLGVRPLPDRSADLSNDGRVDVLDLVEAAIRLPR